MLGYGDEINMAGWEERRMAEGADLLYVDKINVSFPITGGRIEAVKSFSMRVRPGKVTALVGEIGSGKSVLGRSIMGIESAVASVDGRVLFRDPETEQTVDLLTLPIRRQISTFAVAALA